MRLRPSVLLSVLLSSLLILAGTSEAQDFRARLTGRVLDPSGTAIPGASVELQSLGTGAVIRTTTNQEGIYTFLYLNPGTYSLKAGAGGFKTYERTNLVLQTGQSAGIDISLALGALSESVTVTSEAELLSTQTADRGAVVDAKVVAALPVQSRNPLMLAMTLPSVTFRGAAVWMQPFANGAIAEWAMNGGLQRNNQFQIDGAPNNAQAGGNNVAYVPIDESVAEVSIRTNTYDAAFGKTSGGVINLTTKSGTKDFHAVGWDYLRRNGLNANSFQNNAVGAPKTLQRVDEFGFQAAGPMYLGKLIPRKSDRLQVFYLGSYERYIEHLPQPLVLSYPEPEMRTGDFSKLKNAAGAPVVIYDPASGRLDDKNNWIRDPFPANRIPAERIHPVARKVTEYMPLPNGSTPGLRYSTGNLLYPDATALYDFKSLLFRFDVHIGSNHKIFNRNGINHYDDDRPYNGIFEGPARDGSKPFGRTNWAHLVDYVGILSPTLVVNVRVNGARYIEGAAPNSRGDFDLTTLGLPASLASQLPPNSFFGRWNFSNYQSLGQYNSRNLTNTYSLFGGVTKTAGTHSLNFGADVRRTHYIVDTSGNVLVFNNATDFTQRVWNQAASNIDSGDSYATFLLGTPSSGSSANVVRPFYRHWYMALHVKDDWKVTRRLVLNLGLRWDLNTAQEEKHNRMNVGFDGAAPNPIAQQIPAAMLALYPQLSNLKGGLRFAGVDGAPTAPSKTYFDMIQPRIGAAYQFTPRLVVRGGYGLYYANPEDNNALLNAGFSSSTPMVTTLDSGMTALPNVLSNPFPSGLLQPTGASLGPLTLAGQSFSWYNPEYRLPKVHQFSLGFQYQLSRSSNVDLSYVGSRISGLSVSEPINAPGSDVFKMCDPLQGGRKSYCDAALPNPFRGLAPFSGTSLFTAATLTRYQLSRPYPQFTGDLTLNGANYGKSWYNSAQASYIYRMQSGLTVSTSYVFSKQILQSGWMNYYERIPDRSVYFANRPQIFKLTALYPLPIGRGKQLLSSAGGLLNRLVSGWELSTYFNANSGEPANLPSNAIPLRDSTTKQNWSDYSVRAWGACVLSMDNNGVVTPMAYSIQRNGCSATDFSQYQWLAITPTTGYGTVRGAPVRSGQIRVKPLVSMDLSLNKTTHITERLRLQFRADAFNFLNHFNSPQSQFNTNPTDPNFGTMIPSIQSINYGLPRSVQLGFKALW